MLASPPTSRPSRGPSARASAGKIEWYVDANKDWARGRCASGLLLLRVLLGQQRIVLSLVFCASEADRTFLPQAQPDVSNRSLKTHLTIALRVHASSRSSSGARPTTTRLGLETGT